MVSMLSFMKHLRRNITNFHNLFQNVESERKCHKLFDRSTLCQYHKQIKILQEWKYPGTKIFNKIFQIQPQKELYNTTKWNLCKTDSTFKIQCILLYQTLKKKKKLKIISTDTENLV